MKALYLDCFSGISGNMLLGGFISLGVPEKYLREKLSKLGLQDEYFLKIDKVVKKGISAVYVDVKPTHTHHTEHCHRHLSDIYSIINNSTLSERVKNLSKKIFEKLAEAEATVHGTTVEKVHFHEVGAIDSIIDIVGTAISMEYLEINAVYTSKLNVGYGFTQCEHGKIPVPAPATAELLTGIPHTLGVIERELVTPTGAAVVAVISNGFGEMPEGFSSMKVGYGAGTWDLDIPNVLRMYLGNIEEKVENGLVVVETNIDDLDPQVYEYIMDKLLKIGAYDVWITPIIMKKSRPANKLSVLTEFKLLDEVVGLLLKESTTLGVRYHRVNRITTKREVLFVNSPWGQVPVKASFYNGELCNIKPEYSECKKIADQNGLPLKHVLQVSTSLAFEKIFRR